MPFDAHANFAISAVATAPSPATSGTSLILSAGQGSRFPTPPFNATVWATGTTPLPTNAEIVRVTAIVSDTLTITRAQEGSSARSVIVGDQIMAAITAKTLTDIEARSGQMVVDTPEAHGAKRDGNPFTGTYTHTTRVVTATAGASFVAGDVGKMMVMHQNVSRTTFVTTIASVTDATHVVLTADTPGVDLTSTFMLYGTDDTAAINAAITAIVTAGQANESNAGLLQLSAGIYIVAAATTKTTTNLGNSQIPLPAVRPDLNDKFELEIRGVSDGASPIHWYSTGPQLSGSTILSTLQGVVNDSTWGFPSVIGGPNWTALSNNGFSSGYGGNSNQWSNCHVTLTNFRLIVPNTPATTAIDLRSMGTASVDKIGIFPFNYPFEINSGVPTNGTVALYMPSLNNNDYSEIGSYTVYGYAYGIGVSDHVNWKSARFIYCNSAILIAGPGGQDNYVHGMKCGYTSIEGCTVGIDASVFTTITANIPRFPCSIDMINFEVHGSYHVNDPFNYLTGTIQASDINAPTPLKVNGGKNLSITNLFAKTNQTVIDTPENHGAIRDGTTNDTAAIQAAINAVVAAGQANGSNYGEVQFSAGTYLVSSAPGGHGTPTFASAQITLPLIASGTSTQKFTLKLTGLRGAGGALPHWNQTVGQKGGAVLRTTATGTNDVTFGPPAVIGGPTGQQGYGGGTGNAWSNMLVIVDGLTIVSATANPTMSGFNFEGLLEAKVVSAGYMADASPAAMGAFITTPANFTSTWAYGLRMPTTNNNDYSIVDDWSCEGCWYSIIIGEHTHVRDMRSVYCGWGISIDNNTGTPHWSQIDFASVEVCVNTMGLLGSPGANYKVNIGFIDQESVGPIWDSNSLIEGQIRIGANQVATKFDWVANAGLGGVIGGWNGAPTNGQFMTITSPDILPGAGTNQPTVPASGTDFWNKATHDCVVTITGGTVTVIAVDGVTTGLTSGTVIVPNGKKITLTYSVAPTWKWWLL